MLAYCQLEQKGTNRNKFHWNLNQNSIIFIQENAFENVVCQNGGHFVQGEMSYNAPWVIIHPKNCAYGSWFTLFVMVWYPSISFVVTSLVHKINAAPTIIQPQQNHKKYFTGCTEFISPSQMNHKWLSPVCFPLGFLELKDTCAFILVSRLVKRCNETMF